MAFVACGNHPPMLSGGLGDVARVASVIVTYNPDPVRLRENLSAIREQCGLVVVVDNASANRDRFESLVDQLADYVCWLEENEGVAGAYNKAANLVAPLEFKWLLTLDQDSVATPGMVGELVESATGDVGIVVPFIRDRGEVVNRRRSEESPAPFFIKRAIGSGSLVSLDVWAQCGGYDEDLRLDWVDYAFCAAVRRRGYSLVRSPSAVLLHELGRKEVAIRIPRIFGYGGRVLYRTNHADFRWVGTGKSWGLFIMKSPLDMVTLEEIVFLSAIATKIVITERRHFHVLAQLVKGLIAGVRV